uniref:C-type lectin domain-containing protein n=1 Tax=Poecilia mexicana TaxID=48701 RepID=A0A3B3YUD2_9TELE
MEALLFITAAAGKINLCLRLSGVVSSPSSHEYRFVYEPMTWADAQSYCRRMNSDLATIATMEDMKTLNKMAVMNNMVYTSYRTKVWTGLYRDGWKWSAGSRSSFSYWKSTEPNNSNGNEKCVLATFDALGKWEDWRCDVEKAFICSSSESSSASSS